MTVSDMDGRGTDGVDVGRLFKIVWSEKKGDAYLYTNFN